MIRKMYKLSYFDYKSFVIDNYLKLGITVEDALVLIKLLDLFKNTDDYSYSLIEGMGYNYEDLEQIMSTLKDRSLFEIYLDTTDGITSEKVSFNGFFTKVGSILDSNIEYSDDLHKIVTLCQEGLNKILTSSELEIITSLYYDDKYSYDDFQKAITSLKNNKKALNVKALSIILSQNRSMSVNKTPDYVKNFIKNIK